MTSPSNVVAGTLRRRIVIQTPTETVDDHGGLVATFATFDTVSAAILPKPGTEPFEDDRYRATQRVVFEIRYRTGITTKMRVSYDSRLFDIESIVNVEERNKKVLLITEEVDTTS